jgi:glutamate carboxypeptidase
MDPGAFSGWLGAAGDDMVAMLARFAALESPSGDAAALAVMRDAVGSELADLGFVVQSVPGPGGCDHLRAERPGAGPHQLLLGHIDTVWSLGTIDLMPVREEGGRLHGPGVFDMKGGLVQMIFALRALRAARTTPPAPITVFLNCDEEVGSPSSRALIEEAATGADRVLVLEPAYGSDGNLKTARKGIGNFVLRVRGVASHAGLDPEGGASAILALSAVVQQLFALNDPSRGVTVNVGTIDGGLRPNVVAPAASAEVEARVTTAADAAEVEAAIRGLTADDPRVAIEVEGGFRRPPMERTPAGRRLWEHARSCARDIGIDIDEAAVGGGSDGNFTSGLAPTLDGLGAVGDGAHADHEHVVVARMPERAALLAMLMMTPTQGAS